MVLEVFKGGDLPNCGQYPRTPQPDWSPIYLDGGKHDSVVLITVNITNSYYYYYYYSSSSSFSYSYSYYY